MQNIIQWFLDLLQVTGGDLALHKCAWMFTSFRWRQGRASFLPIHTDHDNILVQNSITTKTTKIKRLHPTKGLRTLGCYISGDCTSAYAFKILLQKAKAFAAAIQNSNLTKAEGILAYNLYYLPSIGFSTHTTSLDKTQCNRIQSPILMALLPKMGICRTTSRDIVFGPSELGGLQLHDLYTFQQQQKLKYLIGHLRARDITADLLQISLSVTQLDVGMPTPFLELRYSEYGRWLSTKTWITSLWQFLSHNDITVSLQSHIALKPQRDNNRFIMALAIDYSDHVPTLQSINRCRLYLQVYCLSNISDVHGTDFDLWVSNDTRSEHRQSTLRWPAQGRPSVADWLVWNAFLITIQQTLDRSPLGAWHDSLSCHQQWTYYTTAGRTKLWSYTDGVWHTFQPAGRSTLFKPRPIPVLSTPRPTHPAVIRHRYNKLHIMDSGPISSQLLADLTPSTSAPDLFDTVHPWHRYLVRCPPQLNCPADDLLSITTLLIASDGSVTDTGTYGWLIAFTNGTHISSGFNKMAHHQDDITSYRAELHGIGAALTPLLLLVRRGLFPSLQTATFYIDNKSAMEIAFNYTCTTNVSYLIASDFDIISTIYDLRTQLALDITAEWVKSHQLDQDRQGNIAATLNEACDALVTQGHALPPVPFRQGLAPTENIALFWKRHKITRPMAQAVAFIPNSHRLRKYIERREDLSPATLATVHWKAIKQAMSRLTPGRRFATTKLIFRLWYTGVQQSRRTNEPAICPFCQQPEDWIHVYTCPHPVPKAHRAHAWVTFSHTCQQNHIPAATVNKFTQGYRYLFPNPPDTFPSSGVVAAQTQLGWHQFLAGRLSTEWTQHVPHKSSKDSTVSLSHIVHGIWTYGLALWTFRNEAVHSRPTTNPLHRRLELTSLLTSTITKLKVAIRHLPRTKTQVLLDTMGTIHQRSFHTQLSWYRHAIILLSSTEPTKTLPRHTSDITRFIKYRRPPERVTK